MMGAGSSRWGAQAWGAAIWRTGGVPLEASWGNPVAPPLARGLQDIE